MGLTSHCYQHPELQASMVVLWTPTHGRQNRGHPIMTMVDVLMQDTGAASPEELARCMMDHTDWQCWQRGHLQMTWWWYSLYYYMICLHTLSYQTLQITPTFQDTQSEASKPIRPIKWFPQDKVYPFMQYIKFSHMFNFTFCPGKKFMIDMTYKAVSFFILLHQKGEKFMYH